MAYELILSNFVGVPDPEYARYLALNLGCPVQPPPVIQLYTPTETPQSTLSFAPPTFSTANYYRTPIGIIQVNGQPTSKYHTLFAQPYAAFVYTVGQYAGSILVKSTIPLNTIPNDVVQLSEIEVSTELASYVKNIFAL